MSIVWQFIAFFQSKYIMFPKITFVYELKFQFLKLMVISESALIIPRLMNPRANEK